jgi:hypothetical protein
LTGIAAVFGVSKFFLFTQATNYFGVGAQRNIFSHTWSLGVEEQFYLFFPFLIRWRIPLKGDSFWEDRFRLGALTILSVGSLGLFIWVYRVNQPAAYFLMPCRFWELGFGCLMALIAKITETKGIGHPVKMHAAIPLLSIVPGLFLAGKYPIASTFLVVLATTLLIGSVQKGTTIYRILANPVATYIGAISYSLYLWHWPVICISFWTVGIHPWTLPFQIAAILILSAASYHLIENRLRRATWVGGRWGVIGIGLPAMAIAALLVFAAYKFKIPSFSGNRIAEATDDAPTPGYVSRYSNRKVDDCFADHVFAAKESGIRDNIMHCSAKASAKTELIFVGDSHATDMLPMSDKIWKAGIASVVNITQPGCKAPATRTDFKKCDYLYKLLTYVSTGDDIKRVLVIRNNYSPRRVDGDLSDFSGRLDQLLARTSAIGMKVVYIAPAPKYYSLDDLCTPQWYRPKWSMNQVCQNGFLEDRTEEIARRRDILDYLLGLSKRRQDFFVFDPFDTLCGSIENYCTPVRDGRLIYRDSNHLTTLGSELLAAPFEAFLEEHGLADRSGSGVNKTERVSLKASK